MSAYCKVCKSVSKLLYKSVCDVQYGVKECVDIYKCSKCEHLFVSPDFSDMQISSFYSTYSTHVTSHKKIKIVNFWRGASEIIFSLGNIFIERRNADSLKLNNRKTLKLLDVGCGSGAFLANVSKKNNIIAYGIDFDPKAVDAARKGGLKDVYQKSIKDLNEKFDVITMNHVIEHIQNIEELRTDIVNICDQESLIYLRTPNTQSLCSMLFGKYWRGIKAPKHLNIFSPKSILAPFNTFGKVNIVPSHHLPFHMLV